ncbi:MAG: hypothetical protein LQ346_007222 [Caloplaca aetnensis]|nr:MAG: hypothetical protein LQ346_007222 [Caloplaca aetnensis]
MLNNANLDETPLPASMYNELPHIDNMTEAAAKHAKAHAQLLGLIASYGLGPQFSVHLTHKHFNLPEGRIMVYEAIRGPRHSDFVLCSPRDPEKVISTVRGLYFRALPGGKMIAYEYTTQPGMDMSKYHDFVATFAQTALALGVQDVFALTVRNFHVGCLTEFELPDMLSTILICDQTSLPEAATSTPTDWHATPDYVDYADLVDDGIPGIISLKCIKTRSNKHYNVTCSQTRNGSHYEQTAPSPPKQNMHDGALFLNGNPLPQDSDAFAVISRARELLSEVTSR